MGRIKSLEEFQAEVNEIYGEGEWLVLSYLGTSRQVELRHKCGKERTVSRAKNFLKGATICRECTEVKAGRPRLSFEEIKETIDRITDGEYELISMESATKLVVNHKKCDREPFETSTSRFIKRGQRCQCTKKGRVGRKAE